MKPQFRPYRLINSKELHYFHQNFSQMLSTWSENYCLEAMQIQVGCAAKIENFATMLLLANEGKPIALIDKDYLALLSKILFGELESTQPLGELQITNPSPALRAPSPRSRGEGGNEGSFLEATCHSIFLDLLRQFLELDSLQLIWNSTHYQDWVYPGSACLHLTMTTTNELVHCYLHPEWVLAHLPQQSHAAKPISHLNASLASKKLSLTIEFTPLRLSLEKLLGLCVGDLIKTDHPITSPLPIQYKQQTVCTGIVGQSLQHKSIQIGSSS